MPRQNHRRQNWILVFVLLAFAQVSFAVPRGTLDRLRRFTLSQRQMICALNGGSYFCNQGWGMDDQLASLDDKLRALENAQYEGGDNERTAKAYLAYSYEVKRYSDYRTGTGGLSAEQDEALIQAVQAHESLDTWANAKINPPQVESRTLPNALRSVFAPVAAEVTNETINKASTWSTDDIADAMARSDAAIESEKPVALNVPSAKEIRAEPKKAEAEKPPQKFALSKLEVRKKIARMADRSQCSNLRVSNRSAFGAVPGYFHGVLYTFARSVCRSNDIPKLAMLESKAKPTSSLLIRASTKKADQKLVSAYATVLSLGSAESNGNFRAGRDVTGGNYSGDTAEAGLFQTSNSVRGYLSNRANAGLDKLEDQYSSMDPSLCMVDIFKQSAATHSPRPTGRGEGARMQKLLLNCPALAVEHAAITIQNSSHYGTLNTGLARPIPACRKLIENVYEMIDANRETMCPSVSINPDAWKQEQEQIKPSDSEIAARKSGQS